MSRDKGLVVAELRDAVQEVAEQKRETGRLHIALGDEMDRAAETIISSICVGRDAPGVDDCLRVADEIQRSITLARMKNAELEQRMTRLGFELTEIVIAEMSR